MKREDITNIFPDATKEQIDAIMSANGEDINRARGDFDTLKTQLETAHSELETLRFGATNYAELEKQAASLREELDGMKKAESVRLVREKVAKENKIPVELLTGETEEVCAQQASSILEFAKPSYPKIKDGGEVNSASKSTTREQFAAWAQENL